MKTKKIIIADIDVETGVETTEFYNAVYKTPNGTENGKCYKTQSAAIEESQVYCELFKYKLLYISNNLLFLR